MSVCCLEFGTDLHGSQVMNLDALMVVVNMLDVGKHRLSSGSQSCWRGCRLSLDHSSITARQYCI